MNILFLGSLDRGFYGRDDATVEKLTENSRVVEVAVIQGNARTAQLPKVRNIPGRDNARWTLEAVVEVAKQESPDFAVVGAEEPLGLGIVDMLEAAGIKTFGPNREAAQLEASKSIAIEWMREGGVPHAQSQIFTDQRKAASFARKCNLPIVVKIGCFAGGKGVDLCKRRKDVVGAVSNLRQGYPGEAIIFQEMLVGREFSAFCFTDGFTISDVVAACDYKPRFNGDTGPLTGSMGSFSWPLFWSDHLAELVKTAILQPIVDVMRQKGILYRGVVYAGLMLTADGIRVLEFNCRFGDAEGQVILPLLEQDLFDVMRACRAGTLHKTPVVWNRNLMAATVVMVDRAYPGPITHNGKFVHGLDKVPEGVTVFQYGTKIVRYPGMCYAILGGSGRRLAPMATGSTLEEAVEKVYGAVKAITFQGADWRDDIGQGRNLPEELEHVYVHKGKQ
jgi:phosphoribosylamine---glycine ligase